MDDSDEGLPSSAECEVRCQRFAEVTGTDSACALFFLQNHDWHVERAVDAFFGSSSSAASSSAPIDFSQCKQLTTTPPSTLSVISWNIDGLDQRNLKMRTKAVYRVLESEQADVVMLQELVPCTLSYLREKLTQYEFVVRSADSPVGYFTAILLRRFRVYVDSSRLLPFTDSLMARDLLHVRAHMGSLPLALFTAHLESTREMSDLRVAQMQLCWREMRVASEGGLVPLLAGDLNLRDEEVRRLGGVPSDLLDVWSATGQSDLTRYTWDASRNLNIQLPSSFRPRMRFDRMYVSGCRRLRPVYFGLIGLQKIARTQCFPSDHWGLRADFQVSQ